MKKQLIATLVGGLILFIWQFLSWSLLNVHAPELQYTANQDKVMEALTANLEEGSYFIPNVPPGSGPEVEQEYMKNNIGKPWAIVSYHRSMDMSMGMNMFRGLVVDWVAAFLLVWLLLKFAELNFKTTLLTSLAVGAIGYLTTSYLNSIWFETRSIGHLIDTVAQWGLVGVWLGWWLGRE